MTGGMMFKGTPGPWEHNARTGEFGPTNKYSPVGQIYGGDENGFLVAAAPELLEILIEADKLIIWEDAGLPAPFQERVEAAIAKALGEKK